MPSIAYLITHESGRRVLFDFGVSCQLAEALGEEKAKAMQDKFETEVDTEMIDVLKQSGIEASSIEALIISRAHNPHGGSGVCSPLKVTADRHWDHVGNPSTVKGVKIITTPEEAENLMVPCPSSQIETVKLEDGRKYAAFDGSYDVFGDGSCCLVPMYGHTSQHFGCLVRTRERTYALAADSCHSPKIVASDKYRMSLFGENGDRSFYDDYEEASRTVTRLRACEANGVTVLLAHDPARWKSWSSEHVGVGKEIR